MVVVVGVEVVDGVEGVEGGRVVEGGNVVQSTSSSGQSTKPSHQDVVLMHTLDVGHSLVPSGQGLHTHPHVGVSTACSPYKQIGIKSSM